MAVVCQVIRLGSTAAAPGEDCMGQVALSRKRSRERGSYKRNRVGKSYEDNGLWQLIKSKPVDSIQDPICVYSWVPGMMCQLLALYDRQIEPFVERHCRSTAFTKIHSLVGCSLRTGAGTKLALPSCYTGSLQ